ncbi:MAG: hypothetical protein LBR06_02755 [Bacteroidales bacterium]|jgi:hypothetical protein|nr:hypothetical protein [Bacteroidales bacterium]
MRKIILWSSIAVVVIAGALTAMLLLRQHNEEFSENSAFKAVPLHTPLVIDITDIEAFLRKTQKGPLFDGIRKLADAGSLWPSLDSLAAILRREKAFEDIVGNRELLAAITFVGKEPCCLMSFSFHNRKEQAAMPEIIEKLALQKGAKISRKSYNDAEICTWNGHQTLYYAIHNGMFIIGDHLLSVEESLRQLTASSLLDDGQFMKLYRTISSSSDMNVFIQHEHIEPLFNKIMASEIRTFLPAVEQFANRTELDFTLKEEEIFMAGFSQDGVGDNSFVQSFAQQTPEKFTLDAAVPATALGFAGFCISDFAAFQSDYAGFLKKHSGAFYEREAALKSIDRFFPKPVMTLFNDVAGKNYALIMGMTSHSEPTANRLFVAEITDRKTTETLFITATEKYLAATEKSLTADKSKLQQLRAFQNKWSKDSARYELTLHGKPYVIHRFPFAGFPALLAGKTFASVQGNYVCFYDRYMIFGDRPDDVKQYLDEVITGRTLNKSGNFQQFNKQMLSKSSFFFFLNLRNMLPLVDRFLDASLAEAIKNHEDVARQFYGFGWQFSGAEGGALNNMYVRMASEPQEEATAALWQFKPDAPLAICPQIVVNHNDKANREILLQDTQNQLYLAGRDGALRWKIKLPGKLMGAVHQIDFLRNGKLQFLCNTSDYILLIDRNGAPVKPFPIKLKAPATNGVAVFDYERKRDYRFFVACADHKIYSYDRSGAPVSGWKFSGKTGTVSNPVRHISLDRKDYIVFADENRTWILDRQGNSRADTKPFAHSGNSLYLTTVAAPGMVTTDNKGVVNITHFDGQHTALELGVPARPHWFVAAIFGQRLLYIVAVDRKLWLFDAQGKKQFEHTFNSAITEKPTVYTLKSGEQEIGVVCGDKRQIYLLNEKGAVHRGFPLSGDTPFAIGGLSDGAPQCLITGSNGALLTYKVE